MRWPLVRERLCRVAVSEHFVTDDRDGWDEHEANKTRAMLMPDNAVRRYRQFLTEPRVDLLSSAD